MRPLRGQNVSDRDSDERTASPTEFISSPDARRSPAPIDVAPRSLPTSHEGSTDRRDPAARQARVRVGHEHLDDSAAGGHCTQVLLQEAGDCNLIPASNGQRETKREYSPTPGWFRKAKTPLREVSSAPTYPAIRRRATRTDDTLRVLPSARLSTHRRERKSGRSSCPASRRDSTMPTFIGTST